MGLGRVKRAERSERAKTMLPVLVGEGLVYFDDEGKSVEEALPSGVMTNEQKDKFLLSIAEGGTGIKGSLSYLNVSYTTYLRTRARDKRFGELISLARESRAELVHDEFTTKEFLPCIATKVEDLSPPEQEEYAGKIKTISKKQDMVGKYLEKESPYVFGNKKREEDRYVGDIHVHAEVDPDIINKISQVYRAGVDLEDKVVNTITIEGNTSKEEKENDV